MATCRSCAAEIIWAISEDGRPIPIDAAPVSTGNLVLSQQPGRILARVASEYDSRSRYVTHFATCPQANEWRQR